MSLWAFARRTWDQERARRALLALQEEDGQCAPLLLWSLWACKEGHVLGETTRTEAAKTALPWHIAADELRSARRRLRAADAKPGVLAMIESTSVLAERDLLDRLEALTPSVQSLEPADSMGELSAVIAAWGRPASPERLDALEAALGPEPTRKVASDDDPEMSQLRGLLGRLKDEHGKLSVAVEMLEMAPMPDQLQVARMKRRKLILRDEIVAIENRLMPDIIA